MDKTQSIDGGKKKKIYNKNYKNFVEIINHDIC